MPVNRKMMNDLKKEYGEEKGKSIYYAIEQKRKEKEARHKKAKDYAK